MSTIKIENHLLILAEEEIDMIQESWDFVMRNTAGFGNTLYHKLFTIEPSFREVLEKDIDVHSDKLVSMMAFVVRTPAMLRQPTREIMALGFRHCHVYKIEPQYYEALGTSLLYSLELALGPQWDGDLRHAWAKAYSNLALIMRRSINIL